MRLACTLVLCLLLSPAHAQEAAKPKVLDWKDVPLAEDPDIAAKWKKLRAEYDNREVMVTGVIRSGAGSGEQHIVFAVENPTRRGELVLYQRVRVTMYRIHPNRIQALQGRRVTVVGTGRQDIDVHGSKLMLDKARFVTGKAELRKKP